MLKKMFLTAVPVFMLLIGGLMAAGCSVGEAPDNAPLGSAEPPQFGGESYHLGPFVTYRRASEVAGEWQARGFTTSQVYHNGDGYYFDASR